MSARVVGIGLRTPRPSVCQRQAAQMVAALSNASPSRARALHALYARSGIHSRALAAIGHGGDGAPAATFGVYGEGDGLALDTAARMRAFADLAPPLAQGACEGALARAGVAPGRVTHLVTVSCTGMASPGVDIALINGLGLCAGTQRVHVGFMGCHGAINGLRTARAIALSEPGAVVLLCAVELCSLHMQATQERGCAVADALFADGAAACVVAGSADASAGPALRATGSVLLPDSLEAMGWWIGQHGFAMRLSPEVPAILAEHVGAWVDAMLDARGMDRRAVAGWAIHPGGPRVLAGVADALGLGDRDREASAAVLREHGNMSSATILFIIERLLAAGQTPLLGLAFGPGLSGEAILVGG